MQRLPKNRCGKPDIVNTRLWFTYWGVSPATHATAVGLSVFDGMRWQVDLQRCRVWVGTVAVGTFIRLVFIVLPLVRLWGREDTDRGCWEVHVIWTFAALHLNLLIRIRSQEESLTDLEIRQLGKSLFASRVGAFIRPIAGVDSAAREADGKMFFMTDATARELLQRNIKVYSKQQIFPAYKSQSWSIRETTKRVPARRKQI